MIRYFADHPTAANLVMIAFIVGSAMMTASIGWMSAWLGRRQLFLWAIGLFAVSLVGCGTATTLEAEAIWRFLQGAAGAPLIAVSQITVVNAYTQFEWWGRGRKADYDAIESCFIHVAEQFPDARIGFPLIGAGLAGGDWTLIEPLIEKALQGLDHTLVLFDAPKKRRKR